MSGAYITRLKDTMSRYKDTAKNICDFIGYIYPFIYLLECKTTKGGTFNFRKLTQYDDLKNVPQVLGLNAGVII